MSFLRRIQTNLLEWKASTRRKPLLLRGARQVGKTTLVQQFAKNYRQFVHLNLERKSDISYFDDHDDVKIMMESLFLRRGLSTLRLPETLLFIDEIQASPKAIHLIRYFYEDLPELHVITAGSLLEFAIKDVKSMPVGRVQYMYLHPLDFGEFLSLQGNVPAMEAFQTVPFPAYAHTTLRDIFHRYAIVGGMPEIVEAYLVDGRISALPPIYEGIWDTYRSDVKKYSSGQAERRVIAHIMDSAHLYLDQRIKFQHFGDSNYKSREVGEALRSLNDAQVIRLIYPTTSMEPPIRPDHRKSPRLQFLDTGLVNHALGIQADLLALEDMATVYRGAIIPHLVTQELIAAGTMAQRIPNFWVRQELQSSAEVDLLIGHKGILIPIEVKSGVVGKLRSLHQFVDRSPHPYAVRMYAGALKVERHTTPAGTEYLLMNLPYFLGTKLPEYLEWFTQNHAL